jgi:predicted NBD/HSP70 family sugar kinase
MKQMIDQFSGRKAKDVYEWIRRRGTVSKQELKEHSGLTISTLTRILDELTAAGFIVEVGLGDSTGGRPPILYRTNANYAYVFGLDISRLYTKLVLCDMHLDKIDSCTWRMNESMNPEQLIQQVVVEAQRMMDRLGITANSVLGIGVGAVGPLDRRSGTIINPQNFPSKGWEHVEICALLQEQLNMAVYLDSGANTALLGEYWYDSAERLEHLLYVHVGVGIRSSMIVGGNIVYGAVDMEGAAGQMIIQSDGIAPRHAGGNYGCWESYTSIYALEQAAISYMKQGRASVLSSKALRPERVTYSMLEDALREGDPLAREVFTQSACYFGIGLANLLNILHPQKVILGGPLITGNDLFFEYAKQVAIQKTYHYPAYQIIFEKGKLADDAVALGAAATVIQQLTA